MPTRIPWFNTNGCRILHRRKRPNVLVPCCPASFDVVRISQRIAQGIADPRNGPRQGLVVDVPPVPEPLEQLLARHQPVSILRKIDQDLVGLLGQFNALVLARQLLVARVEHKIAKSIHRSTKHSKKSE